MKLIAEITEDVQYITEAREDGKKDLFIEGIFLQGGIKNRNGRVYPIETLANEVKRYNEAYIAKNRAYGELGHPNGPTINLDRVSHMIKDLRQEGNNFIGRAKIMDTPMGNIVKNLIGEGACIGVSSRGMGSLKLNREGVNEVQNDFYLATAADIVADPSAPDAFVNGIMEGVNFWFDDDGMLHKEVAAVQTRADINELARTKKLSEATLLASFKRYLERI
jgi:hypothetical protein